MHAVMPELRMQLWNNHNAAAQHPPTCTTAKGGSKHAARMPAMNGWRPTAAITSTSLQPSQQNP
jgi:hypothetical protein